MNLAKVDALRQSSRKLIRELGILQLDKSLEGLTPQHCHALVEIGHEPGITVSKLAALLLLSVSAASRLVAAILEKGHAEFRDGMDKREKSLFLTSQGLLELKNIDDYSIAKILGAFEYLTANEQDEIVSAIEKYAAALEKSRKPASKVKILTLSTSRPLRKQIVAMVEDIQKNEFHIPVTDEVNACILKTEEEFYYNNSYNFWYATSDQGAVIGCIGLKKIDDENGQLLKLFVDKRFRGTGVAQSLLATLLKACAKHGFKTLWLGTVKQLTGAHRFYEKSGFQQVSAKSLPKGFAKCHLDTLFFSKNIL